jgi:cobalt-zinc-cadmium resistance protein CzcA
MIIDQQKLQALLNTQMALYPADTILRRLESVAVADSLSLTANPSLGYMAQQVDVSRLEKNLERSRMMPDFNVGYFSQTIQGTQEVNGVPRTFGTGDRFNGVQAGVAIPIWFAPFTAKTKAAKIREQVASANAEYYSKSPAGNYRALLAENGKYNNSLVYYEKQAIPEANMIIDQATQSYKAGAMDYLDYILTLNRALGIRQNYLDALNNYNQTIISIDFITGKIF